MVRDARLQDRAASGLLYVSAQPYYDAYAGRRAQRMLTAIWPKPGHTAAHDRCRVTERDGAIAGVIVAFAAEEGDALARRFLSVSVPRLPVWSWVGVLRHLHAAAEVMPVPPARSLYVDALAVEAGARRRGVATEMLEDAERLAQQRGLRGVALDTGLQNTGAQALYEAHGFEATGEKHAPSDRHTRAIGGPGFVSYYKTV